MSKDVADPSTETPEEVVVLVHGTFASNVEDEGERWWQKGSFFYDELSKRLPDHIRLVEPGEIFRWSGENSHLHRIAGAIKLLSVVRHYEARGVPYHIVAHSHGGSVTWMTLILANAPFGKPIWIQWKDTFIVRFRGLEKPAPLPGLRSVTTVGTPFIQTRKLSNFYSLRSLAYFLVSYLAWGFLLTKYVAEGGPPLAFWLMLFSLNLLAVVFAFIGRLAYFRAFAIMNYFGSVSPKVLPVYRPRWCGIWSEDDEAISVLRTGLHISRTKTKPSVSKDVDLRDFWPNNYTASLYNIGSIPSRITKKFMRRVYLPFLDRALKKRLASFILGVDDLKSVSAVEPWPDPNHARESALPIDVQTELKDHCDRVLAETSGGARPALKYLSLGAVEDAMSAFGDTNKALIHNSYFDNSNVIDIIAAKIHGAR